MRKLITILLLSTCSYAATSNTNFNVTTTVVAVCSLSATNMSFANYDMSVGNVDATSTITATCTTGSAYTIALSVGGGTGAAFSTGRKMTKAADTLLYNLYSNAGRTTIWGDGTDTSSTVAGTGNGAAQNITVYGRIPSAQTSAVGAYSDTVTATITY